MGFLDKIKSILETAA